MGYPNLRKLSQLHTPLHLTPGRKQKAAVEALAVLIFFVYMFIYYEYKLSGSLLLDNHAIIRTGPLIPQNIWQIFLPPAGSTSDFSIDPVALRDTASWLAKNSDHRYTLVGIEGGTKFVREHYAQDQQLLRAYHSLQTQA